VIESEREKLHWALIIKRKPSQPRDDKGTRETKSASTDSLAGWNPLALVMDQAAAAATLVHTEGNYLAAAAAVPRVSMDNT
jgi:hypothetical protein